MMFSLICASTNSLANNGDANDLKHYSAHYDVIVMNGVFFFYQVLPYSIHVALMLSVGKEFDKMQVGNFHLRVQFG